jgi:hypothetical protein
VTTQVPSRSPTSSQKLSRRVLVPTGSDCPRVGEPRVNREHPELLFVATPGGEAGAVVDGNVIIAFCAELTTRSNDNPCRVSHPFVRLG